MSPSSRPEGKVRGLRKIPGGGENSRDSTVRPTSAGPTRPAPPRRPGHLTTACSPARLAVPPRPPQPTRVPGDHSPVPDTTTTGGDSGPGRAHSCCRGAGLRTRRRIRSLELTRLRSVSLALLGPSARGQKEQAPAAASCARRLGRRRPRQLLPPLGGAAAGPTRAGSEARPPGEGGTGAGPRPVWGGAGLVGATATSRRLGSGLFPL